MNHVFLSYDMKHDREITKEVADALKQRGISCWYANQLGEAGDWGDNVDQELGECYILILILTEKTEFSTVISSEVHDMVKRVGEWKKTKKKPADIQIVQFDGQDLSETPGTVRRYAHTFPRFNCSRSRDLKDDDRKKLADFAKHIYQVLTEKLQIPIGKQEPDPVPIPDPVPNPVPIQPAIVAAALLLLFVLAITGVISDLISDPNSSGGSAGGPSEEEIQYENAENFASSDHREDRLKAAMLWGALGDYEDAKKRSFEIWVQYRPRETLSAGNGHIVALDQNGQVVSAGDNSKGQGNVSGFNRYSVDVDAVSAGDRFTVALLADQTVVATGNAADGQINVRNDNWKNIIQISAGDTFTVGLRKDGTVVLEGKPFNQTTPISPLPSLSPPFQSPNSFFSAPAFSPFQSPESILSATDIVAVDAGSDHVVVLHADGTAEAAGANESGQCMVNGEEWINLVAVSAGYQYTAGLRLDGTVVATGGYHDLVGDWAEIQSISAGYYHLVGLGQTGQVYSVGSYQDGECDFDGWKDIVAISAGWRHTIGLRKDGSVVSTSRDAEILREISTWESIKLPAWVTVSQEERK